ncbi:hypothetical protein GCM10009681_05400 [Luedemannella helvata]|uniref:OmpR/PhoB-type domain-containing protein n=1 Tax=Luedemannella helvata TaxID=349315 RepID=A0ABN2JSJ7_9ACTN
MTALRMLVLGPVEVRLDARDLLSGCRPAQRAVLGLLAVRANRVVSRAQLIDRLWGDHPPATADQLIQGYVSRLRAALRRGGETVAARLTTTGGGYLLTLGDGELDLLDFERHAAAGARVAAGGDYAGAARELRRALALWRGPALGGLPLSTTGEAEVTRLEEARLACLDQRIEADLRDGRHATVTGELRALVAEHPLREPLWAHLMTALWQGGRKADALAAYAEARDRLRTELGLEPGADLRELSARIRTEPGPALSLVPAELPPDPPTFTGRREEVAYLRDRLLAGAAGAPIVAISGAAGAGKSALAAHLAHVVADAYPDGQLYTDLRGSTADAEPRSPVTVLHRFLRGLGIAGSWSDVDEAAARFRSATAQRRVLVVLDNATTSAQVRPMLPASPGCAAVITSRAALTGLHGAVHVRLDALSEAEAVELLGRLAGPARVAAEPAAAARVAGLCDRLPLALLIAGTRLAARPAWTVAELAARLRDDRRRLDELSTADLAMRCAFAVSYRSLSGLPGLQRAFRLCGLLPGTGFDAPALAALLAAPVDDAAAALERLVDANLVTSAGRSWYRLAPLVRLYARELAAADRPAARLPQPCGSAVPVAVVPRPASRSGSSSNALTAARNATAPRPLTTRWS